MSPPAAERGPGKGPVQEHATKRLASDDTNGTDATGGPDQLELPRRNRPRRPQHDPERCLTCGGHPPAVVRERARVEAEWRAWEAGERRICDLPSRAA